MPGWEANFRRRCSIQPQIRRFAAATSTTSPPTGCVARPDGAAVAERGFFQGYTWLTASVVLQVSAGGLLVGLIMKYADNLLKGFATSLSIILSSVVSTFIPAFGFEPGLAFFCGSALVIAATIIYSSPAAVIAVGDVGIV